MSPDGRGPRAASWRANSHPIPDHAPVTIAVEEGEGAGSGIQGPDYAIVTPDNGRIGDHGDSRGAGVGDEAGRGEGLTTGRETTGDGATIPGVPSVPIGFPFELDDEQLGRAIADMLEPRNWPGFDDFATLGLEHKLALVDAGLRERQQRDQREAAARALRVAYATLAVSLIALVVAVIASVTA